MYSLKNPHFYKLTSQIKKESIKLYQKASNVPPKLHFPSKLSKVC